MKNLASLAGVLALVGCYETSDTLPPETITRAMWPHLHGNCHREDTATRCMPFEACIQPDGNASYQVCASACAAAEDCEPGLFTPLAPWPDYAAEPACRSVAGTQRCVLACSQSSDCPESRRCATIGTCQGAECVDGACFWPLSSAGLSSGDASAPGS